MIHFRPNRTQNLVFTAQSIFTAHCILYAAIEAPFGRSLLLNLSARIRLTCKGVATERPGIEKRTSPAAVRVGCGADSVCTKGSEGKSQAKL
ncbi:hypothetical protein Rcae01_04331 [Novipirellula caenicola]|uniref:Uncharacterized protein n=1 Tax=Novipirellula caenicola TaxID=1536901 RepID=A0ABP9VUN9_9BACT